MIVATVLILSTVLGVGFSGRISLDYQAREAGRVTRSRDRAQRRRDRQAAKSAAAQAHSGVVPHPPEATLSSPWLFEFATQLKSIF